MKANLINLACIFVGFVIGWLACDLYSNPSHLRFMRQRRKQATKRK